MGGVVWLWRQAFLRDTALLVAGSNLLFQALVLVVIVIAREQGASATQIGVMLGGLGVGGLLGSLVAGFLLEAVGTTPATLVLTAGMLALAVVATASRAIRNAPARVEPAAPTPAS